ncbi:MAG TPA: TfoX/Sxy family protein [Saprospiraceae bacterium]|jgi:TfoX/Sxy family transcriptional regulator of competence genes
MGYNESLADRVHGILEDRKVKHTDKKMFGGLCFLVDDKMLMGVEKNRLMVRIDPEDESKALKRKGAKPMDFTGRVMKGYLFIDDTAVDMDKDLEYWVDLCLKYNPKAKASKKKAKAKAEAKKKA